MGWYQGLGGRLVLRSASLPVRRQPACTHVDETGLTECHWRPTLSFAIPAWLDSGVYIAKLSAGDGAESDCLFVVRALRPRPLLVEIPTASYEAYNAWGGDSLYPGGADRVGVTHTNQGVEVSYDRPYQTQTGAGQFFIREVAIVRFLERYGYPVSYTTIESIDGDPGQTLGARALIDVGHSEYWSKRDQQAFAAARERGVNLVFLSSDTMAWRVRFKAATRASSQAGQPDHVIVAYKEFAASDPDRADPTGLTPGGGASLTGTAYDGCITPRVPSPDRPSIVTTRGILIPASSPDGCSLTPASAPAAKFPASSATSSTSRRSKPPPMCARSAPERCPARARTSPRRCAASRPTRRCTPRARARSCSPPARSAGCTRSRPCRRHRRTRRTPRTRGSWR